MKEDYELLKKYLQNEIDTGNNKTFIFDKDDVIDFKNCNALSYIENMEEKIKRLNNIVDKFEKWLDTVPNYFMDTRSNNTGVYIQKGMQQMIDMSKNKLQELKGSDK